MFAYPAKIIQDGECYLVSFRDFEGKNPVVQGFSREKALEMAKDWLLCAAAVALDNGKKLPESSLPEKEEVMVEMPISAQVKLLLLYEMLDQSVSGSELARRMNIKRFNVQKIIKVDHTTKIDTLDKAMHALGKKIKIELVWV